MLADQVFGQATRGSPMRGQVGLGRRGGATPFCRPAVAQALIGYKPVGDMPTPSPAKNGFDPPARKIAMGIKVARKVTGPSRVGPRVASAGRRYPAFRPAAASSFGLLSLG